jgi:hypothetical protein
VDDLVSAELADEVAILHLESGVYYGLNAVGAFIWDLLQAPMTVDQVTEAVFGEFDVPLEQCEQDVSKLLKKLAEENLIEIRDGE